MTKKRKPAKVRKPKGRPACYNIYDDDTAWVEWDLVGPKEARRLAAWLIRFADWADSRSKGGKG